MLTNERFQEGILYACQLLLGLFHFLVLDDSCHSPHIDLLTEDLR